MFRLRVAEAPVFVSVIGSGSGSSLNPNLLLCAGISTAVATIVAGFGIFLQLKNYRKPALQRMVVRIMLMVPIYAISSLIALFSLEAAFVIDAIRDIYEAFVIYCFFHLLLSYLGGERSVLVLLYGRPPKRQLFPVSIFKHEIDPSDPFTFLFLRRGILQYVQVKPVLAVATLLLKATGTYNEGDLHLRSGYLWVSVVYNTSIFVALYCLATFWLCVSVDLQPFRPIPKFLCVKGILFFSFWQSIFVSILVAAGAIKQVGPYTDSEHISLAITDLLICFEMPFFAFAHWFAFSHRDYIDKDSTYSARMPMYYAVRDAFGLLDVIVDSRATLEGGGVSYKTAEPVEGGMHQGSGRDRRIRAGLRYAKGGQKKYWLPMPDDTGSSKGPFRAAGKRISNNQGYAPLLDGQADDVVHDDSDSDNDYDDDPGKDDFLTLDFDSPEGQEDMMYEESRKLVFGDYNYPNIDTSREDAKRKMWEDEERILRDQRAAAFIPERVAAGLAARGGRYGAVGISGGGLDPSKGKATASSPTARGDTIIDLQQDEPPAELRVGGVKMKYTKTGRVDPSSSRPSSTSPRASPTSRTASPRPKPDHRRSSNLPADAVDLVVEDKKAAESEMIRERRQGEPAIRQSGMRKVYRQDYKLDDGKDVEVLQERDEGIENPARGDRPEVEETRVKVRSPGADEHETADARLVGEESEIRITRATTPPPHARVEVEHYQSPVYNGDDNPWA